MTYRKDSGSFMKTYRTGGAGAGSGAGYTKEQVETDEVYKLLTKNGAALGGGTHMVKLVKVPKKSTLLPELEDKAYSRVTTLLSKEIERLGKMQTDVNTATTSSYGGTEYTGGGVPTFEDLSPYHAQQVIKLADRLYDVYSTLSDTDWEDIMDDVGITSKKKKGVTTYTYAQIKEEANEIIQKFIDNKSHDSQLTLSDFEFRQFVNEELKERRNVMANSFGNIDMTPQIRQSGVLHSNLLKVTILPSSSSLRPNVGLPPGGKGSAEKAITAFITSLYNAL